MTRVNVMLRCCCILLLMIFNVQFPKPRDEERIEWGRFYSLKLVCCVLTCSLLCRPNVYIFVPGACVRHKKSQCVTRLSRHVRVQVCSVISW